MRLMHFTFFAVRQNKIVSNMEETKLMNNIRNGYAKTLDDNFQLITGTQGEWPAGVDGVSQWPGPGPVAGPGSGSDAEK